ncbi:MAG: nucleotidyltransferase family protein [Actinomycetota bacterium]|nr:nucleotidyltransferase family protein [Actinomycetota bacterium]
MGTRAGGNDPVSVPLTAFVDDQAGDVLLQMQDGGAGLAVVTDHGGRVVGTVADGDIRRAVLAGADLSVPVSDVMGDDPALVTPATPDDEARGLLERLQLPAAAVVDGDDVVGFRHLVDAGGTRPAVSAVVLAGGRGQRLRPLTDKVPKPLLTVGRTTIVERLLEALRDAGVVDVYLSVNYKAEVFEERLGHGEAHGVRLRYLREHKELHTAGPLSLLPEPPAGPVLVMNADQVTALHFARLVDFHHQQGASVTVGAFRHEVRIPYGVLRIDGGRVAGIDEKPTIHQQCNAGIYVVEPDVVSMVPRNTFFGMPELVEAALADGRAVAAFPIVEKFIDIGTLDELEAALVYFATGEEV